MKKLMIALAVVGMAVASQAAAYNWTSGALKKNADAKGGWTSTAITSGQVAGYLFVIDETTYNSLNSTVVKTVSDNVYAAYGSKLKDASATKSTGTTIALTDGVTTYGAGTTQYAALLYILTNSDGKFYIGNVGTMSMASAQNKTMSNMATNLNGGTGTSMTSVGWQAIPEPTSGLLLLLGVAGLALKRKQK